MKNWYKITVAVVVWIQQELSYHSQHSSTQQSKIQSSKKLFQFFDFQKKFFIWKMHHDIYNDKEDDTKCLPLLWPWIFDKAWKFSSNCKLYLSESVVDDRMTALNILWKVTKSKLISLWIQMISTLINLIELNWFHDFSLDINPAFNLQFSHQFWPSDAIDLSLTLSSDRLTSDHYT